MECSLCRSVEAFAQTRVLVVGDAILDGYLEGPSRRLCREAPVPVVELARESYAPGGAANVAANVHSLGAACDFLAVVGDDAEGALLRRELGSRGVDRHLLVERSRRTTAKHRLLADSHLVARYDRGEAHPLRRAAERKLIARLETLYFQADAVVISDYGYGLFTPSVIDALAQYQRRGRRVLTIDSRRRLEAFARLEPTLVKPNYREALALPGLDATAFGQPPLEELAAQPGSLRAGRLASQGDRILDATGARIAAITLDTEGALVFQRGQTPYRTYAQPRPESRAAGAGDTFAAAMTLALAAGADSPAAAEIASAAAALVVAKGGTACCRDDELVDALSGAGKVVAGLDRLLARLQTHRAGGRRIVFTNGCFDILHSGHIAYLNQAKAAGDVLVVAVNSDSSTRRLKGPGRPVNSLEDRMQVLAALSSVDHIVAFEEDTCEALVLAIRPEVFAKGGNYRRESIAEADLVERCGGKVILLPYVDNRSTTRLIQRIQTGTAVSATARDA